MIKSVRLKILLIGLILFFITGCGTEDWRDPLNISRAGSGNLLNPDGTPYVPVPGHLELSQTELTDIPYKFGTDLLSTPIILKNTGTKNLTVKSVQVNKSWLTVSGISHDEIIEPFDSIKIWIRFGNSSLNNNSYYTGTINFTWASLDNPDSLAIFDISLDVGNESAWDLVYSDIMENKCSCHMTADGSGELKLKPKSLAYSSLVNIDSHEKPNLKRIVPYDPDASYLVKKIIGVDIEGDRMPRDGPPFLSDNRINQIRKWIQIGAPE